MFIKQFLTGGDRNYGYLAADDEKKRAAIIDPSYSPKRIVDLVQDKGYTIEYVFSTHDHYDHTNGNRMVEKLTGKTPLLFGDKDPASGIIVSDGARIPLGKLEITILHTPGHTHDSICIHVGDAVFTGDTLFVGKVGGTYGRQDAAAEFESLNRLMALDPETEVWPGHDCGIRPKSTIGDELRENPFIKRLDNFEDFLWLKENWARYKIEHGIK